VPRRLRPTADIYEDAILVGDPGRAMALAQVVIEGPKMSNHARGLWGYSGPTPEGRGLVVQATGMGGPSAAVVLADLVELGVRRAVRIGTGAALSPDLRPGDLVSVSEARAWSAGGAGAAGVGGDRGTPQARPPTSGPGGHVPGGGGPSAEPGADASAAGMGLQAWSVAAGPAVPDPTLTERLRAELGDEARPGRAASLDVLHPADGQPLPAGDVADMQTASLLAAARKLRVALAAVLIVTEVGGMDPLGDDELTRQASLAAEAATRAFYSL
jgi:hypothetical protein